MLKQNEACISALLEERKIDSSILNMDEESVLRYCNKIKKNAVFEYILCNEEIAGFIAYYANDIQRRQGYITMVLIRTRYRGRGFSSILLERVLDKIKSKGFGSCKLEVEKKNVIAIQIYEKFGFIKVEDTVDGNGFYMIKEFL